MSRASLSAADTDVIPKIFEDDNPRALEQFVKAVAANARRYASTDSAFNKELAPGLANGMLASYLNQIWVRVLRTAGCRLIDASLQGAPPLGHSH